MHPMPKSTKTKPSKPAVKGRATPKKRQASAAVAGTKAASILKLLSRAEGATIEELVMTTGWQQHSIRGFFAGHIRKKLGLELSSEKTEDGLRHYRVRG
ncbi:hypothetical protein BH10PSE7_BH10PSE7_23760 [soil metagenome]